MARGLRPAPPARKERRMAEDDPFDRDHAPPVGTAEALAPGLRVVTAPNPGPMTFTGTRSYVVGEGEVAVIDPGPADPAPPRRAGGGGGGRAGGGGPRHPRAPRPQRGRPRLRRRRRRAGAGARSRRAAAAGPRERRRRGAGRGLPPRRGDRRGPCRRRAGLDADRARDPRPHRRPPGVRLAGRRRALLGRPRHGLGDDADLAPGRDARRLPRQPAPTAGPSRNRLLSRPRRPGPRSPAHRRAHPRAPRAARGGDRRRAGGRAGDRRRAGGGALRRRRPARCTAPPDATCSRT